MFKIIIMQTVHMEWLQFILMLDYELLSRINEKKKRKQKNIRY